MKEHMNRLTWFQHNEGCYEIALVGGGSLKMYYRGNVHPQRLVEFNGMELGFAEDRLQAEALLSDWCNAILARLGDV